MWTTQTIEHMRRKRHEMTGTVGLTPTMGGLHAGHQSLIRQARQRVDHVIVSLFVNPTQFGPQEDYQSYPRSLEQDLALCEEAGAEGVFNPSVAQMYPPGVPACQIQVPALAQDLEGRMRPGHFAGVCRVVAKLFHITQPHLACFGRKDFQQLRVIQAMVADLNMPIMIAECPTVREPDGLALSTRNRYLGPEDRHNALGLYKALRQAKTLVEENGESDPKRVEQSMRQVLQAHQVQVDYAVVRHPLTLVELDNLEPKLTGGVIALVAGRVGSTRLIDNLMLGAGTGQE